MVHFCKRTCSGPLSMVVALILLNSSALPCFFSGPPPAFSPQISFLRLEREIRTLLTRFSDSSHNQTSLQDYCHSELSGNDCRSQQSLTLAGWMVLCGVDRTDAVGQESLGARLSWHTHSERTYPSVSFIIFLNDTPVYISTVLAEGSYLEGEN